jgi:hypothetical protein
VQALRQLTAKTSSRQNGIGAIVERLQRWNDAATTDPDEGDREKFG